MRFVSAALMRSGTRWRRIGDAAHASLTGGFAFSATRCFRPKGVNHSGQFVVPKLRLRRCVLHAVAVGVACAEPLRVLALLKVAVFLRANVGCDDLLCGATAAGPTPLTMFEPADNGRKAEKATWHGIAQTV